MEKIIRAMMDLIASEVCGKAIDRSQDVLAEAELAALYRLSKAHDLAHIVGDALMKNDLIPEGEIRSKFDKQLMMAVYRYERINYELDCLRTVLNEARIPFLPLKGSVIRQYYPEPWMRTSCDIDILVSEEEADRTAQLLVARLGYRKEGLGSHDISLFSEHGVHLELHYSLIEENWVGHMASVLQSVWEHAYPVAGTSEYAMSDEMFYYYHLAHMAKHFVYGGCGIRPFLDLWVLNHRVPFDREKRDRLLEQGSLLTFAARAEALSEVWFGDGAHTDVTRQMQAYLLRGGVYGTTENRVAVQQVKKGGKLRYALSRIWLPYDVLRFQYPSLTGKKVLLPLYEVRRWFKLLFRGGVRRSVNELRLNSATSGEEQTKTKALLGELGIDS
mgnify:FL=1